MDNFKYCMRSALCECKARKWHSPLTLLARKKNANFCFCSAAIFEDLKICILLTTNLATPIVCSGAFCLRSWVLFFVFFFCFSFTFWPVGVFFFFCNIWFLQLPSLAFVNREILYVAAILLISFVNLFIQRLMKFITPKTKNMRFDGPKIRDANPRKYKLKFIAECQPIVAIICTHCEKPLLICLFFFRGPIEMRDIQKWRLTWLIYGSDIFSSVAERDISSN